MFKALKVLVVSTVILFQTGAIAAPPKFVYRFDTRPPDEIFKKGFSSWGDNDNVFAHISGQSCVLVPPEQRTTAFIATTSDHGWASSRAITLSLIEPYQRVYVYRIRADSNFYSGMDSLNRYIRSNPQVRVSPENMIVLEESNEYMAHRRIRPENVESATVYYRGAGSPEPNPGYVSENTHANVVAYGGTADSVHNRLTWVSFLPFMGACFSDFGSDKRAADNRSHVITLESVLLPSFD